jgi:hypothetical protein
MGGMIGVKIRYTPHELTNVLRRKYTIKTSVLLSTK